MRTLTADLSQLSGSGELDVAGVTEPPLAVGDVVTVTDGTTAGDGEVVAVSGGTARVRVHFTRPV